MSAPRTMAARRARIEALIEDGAITSQQHLRSVLDAEGMAVTQATLSRDLEALGAVKTHDAATGSRYVISRSPVVTHLAVPTTISRVVTEVLVGAEPAQNIAVLHTPPGAAHYLAGYLDRAHFDQIVGTVAGDDTIMVVLRTAEAAQEFCATLLSIADRRGDSIAIDPRQRRTS
ncbi:MAG: arginine repressor [Candidatus Nanopelagicales bacterium]|nr:arginine repressor [Candidatus Nanopelagicales bacterium]